MDKYILRLGLFFLIIIHMVSGALSIQSKNGPLQSATLPVNGGTSLMTPMSRNTQTAASITPAKSIPSYSLYSYHGDRYRDPFISLIGEARGDQTDRAPQISSMVLKGVVQDSKVRMALLTSGISSYILRNGRLYDSRNKMVKGISGVIKMGSVVLIGADHTVKELKIDQTKL